MSALRATPPRQGNSWGRSWAVRRSMGQEHAPVAGGGVTEVGWSASGEHVLVISASGRGVLDATTGAWVGRDRGTDFGDWFDPFRLIAAGTGPCEGEQITMAGLAGGGLAALAHDGWSLEIVYPDWPMADIILCAPGLSILHEPGRPGRHLSSCRRIARTLELRAAGFSPTGDSIVVAAGDGVTIFRRSS